MTYDVIKSKSVINYVCFKHMMALLLLSVLLVGCKQDKVWPNDNEIKVGSLVEEFTTGEAMIGSNALLELNDSLLLINDAEAYDELVSVFRLPDGQYEGSFVEYGPGPYEVGSAGGINLFADAQTGKLKTLVFDYAQNSVLSYDMDSIFKDGYQPTRLKSYASGIVPSDFIYVNDTLGFARKVVLSPTGNGFTQSLGKYNLTTGELSDFAPEYAIENNNSLFAVSKKDGLIAEVATNVDVINIYDFDGKLLHQIRGPEYKDKAERLTAYFSSVVFADDLILAVYSGGKWNTDFLGKEIVVIDKEGNYKATLDLERKVRDMKYHEPTGRLYMSFYDDDMQFGWLDLHSVL